VYDYLRGRVASRDAGSVVMECGGVGYRLQVSATTLSRVPANGEVLLYTHLLVREDAHELIGFAEPGERHLFRQLLGVSGVGPAVALGLLSAYEPEALAALIAAGDPVSLTRVKGVGKRTAERILVELRDRIRKEGGLGAAPSTGNTHTDAVLALCSLGLPRAEAERRVATVKGEDLSVEEIVREALR
jgi:Holliday junction DNA helicase RuvA